MSLTPKPTLFTPIDFRPRDLNGENSRSFVFNLILSFIYYIPIIFLYFGFLTLLFKIRFYLVVLFMLQPFLEKLGGINNQQCVWLWPELRQSLTNERERAGRGSPGGSAHCQWWWPAHLATHVALLQGREEGGCCGHLILEVQGHVAQLSLMSRTISRSG